MNVLISAKNLTKKYGEAPNETVALENISIEIKNGEFTAIIGPSGSGKSTLMHIMGCLDKPTEGEYFFRGREVSKLSDNSLAEIRNKQIGFVFQFFNLLPRTLALKNAELPLLYAGVDKEERHSKALKILSSLGLSERVNSTPGQLSGGEQQRVAIARALIKNPSVIFADEPTGNVDTKTSREIMKIFQSLNKRGNTIIVITHDPEVATYASRIITVRDGKVESDKKIKRRK